MSYIAIQADYFFMLTPFYWMCMILLAIWMVYTYCYHNDETEHEPESESESESEFETNVDTLSKRAALLEAPDILSKRATNNPPNVHPHKKVYKSYLFSIGTKINVATITEYIHSLIPNIKRTKLKSGSLKVNIKISENDIATIIFRSSSVIVFCKNDRMFDTIYNDLLNIFCRDHYNSELELIKLIKNKPHPRPNHIICKSIYRYKSYSVRETIRIKSPLQKITVTKDTSEFCFIFEKYGKVNAIIHDNGCHYYNGINVEITAKTNYDQTHLCNNDDINEIIQSIEGYFHSN